MSYTKEELLSLEKQAGDVLEQLGWNADRVLTRMGFTDPTSEDDWGRGFLHGFAYAKNLVRGALLNGPFSRAPETARLILLMYSRSEEVRDGYGHDVFVDLIDSWDKLLGAVEQHITWFDDSENKAYSIIETKEDRDICEQFVENERQRIQDMPWSL